MLFISFDAQNHQKLIELEEQRLKDEEQYQKLQAYILEALRIPKEFLVRE